MDFVSLLNANKKRKGAWINLNDIQLCTNGQLV